MKRECHEGPEARKKFNGAMTKLVRYCLNSASHGDPVRSL
jgi:hypothetical protein